MSFGTKPCTCQGNNPDCYRCAGTGFIEPSGLRSPESSSDSFRTLHHMCKCTTCRPSQTSISTKKPRNYTILIKPPPPTRRAINEIGNHVCPICDRRLKTQQGLFQHNEQKHGIFSKSKIPIAPLINSIVIGMENYCMVPDAAGENYDPKKYYRRLRFICPHCGITLINEARLEKHVSKVHPVDSIPSNKVLPTYNPLNYSKVNSPKRPVKHKKSSITNRLKYQCHVCRLVLSSTKKLIDHINKIHKAIPSSNEFERRELSAVKQSSISSRSKSTAVLQKTLSSNPATDTKIGLVYEFSERMDATRVWGGSFRDNGQFGSYPGHDSMDDESFS